MLPKLLLVLTPEFKERLLEILDRGEFLIECAPSFQSAHRVLHSSERFDLLFVDAELQGGVWQDLLTLSRRRGTAVAVVVCARLGNHQLWSEVLQSGAYDLITEPLDAKEVARIVEGALNSPSTPAADRLRSDRFLSH